MLINDDTPFSEMGKIIYRWRSNFSKIQQQASGRDDIKIALDKGSGSQLSKLTCPPNPGECLV